VSQSDAIRIAKGEETIACGFCTNSGILVCASCNERQRPRDRGETRVRLYGLLIKCGCELECADASDCG
jgi:aerobic-type carbon monoxide dehydrogenase small subunit (CoxS/CutS family)